MINYYLNNCEGDGHNRDVGADDGADTSQSGRTIPRPRLTPRPDQKSWAPRRYETVQSDD